MIRIAITGPESSGKTTLSNALGELYQVNVIPEYARAYLEQKKGSYIFEDLEKIAEEQVNLWEPLGVPQICDTEMTVIKVWSEVKFEKTSVKVQQLYEAQSFDHYFLCRPDIPWEPDPLRENPNDREELFERYKKELTHMIRPFTIIEGSLSDRLITCKEVIGQLDPFFKK